MPTLLWRDPPSVRWLLTVTILLPLALVLAAYLDAGTPSPSADEPAAPPIQAAQLPDRTQVAPAMPDATP